jgi:hypothetical protein
MITARGRREPTIPYQVSRRTSWPGPALLADIANLDVAGVELIEQGSTYLILAPHRAGRYGPGTAVALAIAVTLTVLAASATSAVLVALLPAALIPLVPLLLPGSPRLMVGAVPEGERHDGPSDTLVTVSGDMWHALAVPLHSYLSALPPGTRAASPAED